jgi:hypothetical protein
MRKPPKGDLYARKLKRKVKLIKLYGSGEFL